MILRRAGSALVVLLISQFSVFAAELTFQPLVLSSNRLQLVLLGNTGTTYSIENSSNLIDWTTLYSSVAANGRIEFSGPLPSLSAQFFRGRAVTAAININPQISTNTGQLFATMQGGAGIAYGPDGSQFTLAFPSNNIVTPTTMTVTVVTSINGLPFAGGLIGAVRIGPDNPDLFGAGTLTIPLPQNIDRRKIISFRANADGSNFALTPDRVTTNGVIIPITRSGIFGSAIATTQEIAHVSQAVSASIAGARAAKKSYNQTARDALPTSVLCFPELVGHAVFVRAEINADLEKAQSEMAAMLGVERQKQPVGVESDPSSIFSEVGPRSCAFFRQHIEPRWPEAASNCSMMNVLLQFALGMERQMQLLGVSDEERCTANVLSAEMLCPGFKACLNEIEACCAGGHKERERLVDIVSLVRQQALLGIEGYVSLGCFDLNDDRTQDVIHTCTGSQWTGSVTVKESGESYERFEAPNGYSEDTQTYEASYSGFVISSTDQVIPGLGVLATLSISGHASARAFDEYYSISRNTCGNNITRDKSEESVTSRAAFSANVSIQSTNYTLGIAFVGLGDGQQFWIDGEERSEYYNYTIGGIGCSESGTEFRTKTENTVRLLPSLLGFAGSLSGDTNSISGSTNYTSPGLMPTTVEIKWNFQRSKSQ